MRMFFLRSIVTYFQLGMLLYIFSLKLYIFIGNSILCININHTNMNMNIKYKYAILSDRHVSLPENINTVKHRQDFTRFLTTARLSGLSGGRTALSETPSPCRVNESLGQHSARQHSNLLHAWKASVNFRPVRVERGCLASESRQENTTRRTE